MLQPGALDQLHQVHELNRAFLGLLQSRVRQRRPCLGLPPSAQPALAAAGTPLLEGVAAFPRALFQLQIGGAAQPTRLDGDELDESEHDLCFSILFAARQSSRASAYQARLLFGLDPADVERLRGAALGGLQQLAAVPGVLECAYRDQAWFWHGLITATRPELRRQLMLMALQPRVAAAWPQRRPPQAMA
jgi:hypothetical protein